MSKIVNGVANDFEYDFSMFPPNVEKIIITKDNYKRLFKNLQEENIIYKEVLNKIRKNNERIIDYGFDYDGFNNVEDLKKLIDMLVDYAKQNDKLLEEIE